MEAGLNFDEEVLFPVKAALEAFHSLHMLPRSEACSSRCR